MKRKTFKKALRFLIIPGVLMLPGCQGILLGIYDDPESAATRSSSDQLYVDASSWTQWHYIDLHELADTADIINSSLWKSWPIPISESNPSTPEPRQPGIYTYWYDVFGAGISNCDFRGFVATEAQAEPENWTFGVHRNNVRTNNCQAYETDFYSIDDVPRSIDWLESLAYSGDEWNQTDVWAVQDKMLSGIIGNQGICINNVLSGWLKMEIPPMPPLYRMNGHVFILKLPDSSYAAIQLADYISGSGVKCCLTINYKYPLI